MSGVDQMDTAAVLDRRLDNWGRWCRQDGMRGPKTCASAERHYRPRAADDEGFSDRVMNVVDDQDAQIVERAILRLQCLSTRQFLVAHYQKGCRISFLARALECTRDQVAQERIRCLFVVGAEIAYEEAKLIKRGKPHWAGCIT